VNEAAAPVVVFDPSLAVAYHSYFFPDWSPVHWIEAVDPDATLRRDPDRVKDRRLRRSGRSSA
jgi:hypothetical protein